MPESGSASRVAEIREVEAFFGAKKTVPDPEWHFEFAAALRETHSIESLIALSARFSVGESAFDYLMRRVLFHAICKSVGHDLRIAANITLVHPETIEFGDSVFIGAQTVIQGRIDGSCKIGNHVWIGPQAYFDARALVIEDYVGWGPGAKVLGSEHTGIPADVPVIKTALTIKPVIIGYGSDIGTNATILPGVRVGTNAVVGAGAVVNRDVPDYAVVAGVPAHVLRFRRE